MNRLILVVLFFVSFALGQLVPVPPIPLYNCSKLPTPPPATKVTQLRPGNIKVVMALGDSISAGFAMDTGVPLEWRGLVFSIGGDKYETEFSDDPAVTIPNYLLHYNPSLVGTSVGTTIPLTKGSALNGAVSGARVEQVPDQVITLFYLRCISGAESK
eukprot:TRINITY_DN4168_c0_g1_i6.p1 TRINITY_DN4168_c0_g1~~TRINITY_DN4168_c0_g1_i6.p1  ORF type:complete len:176 (-),score=24.99 TRINITY_DN4168_c0_g1_i6:9-482(-)